MNKTKVAILPILAIAVSCAPGAGGPLGGGGGDTTAGGELSGRCTSDMGTTAAAQKLEAFLLATARFTGTAAELQQSLFSTCVEMGQELGMSGAELQASPGTPAANDVCNAVAARLQSELQGLRAEADLRVTVVAEPPRCEVSMDAYAECAAECDATVEPGQVDVQCEGGEIVGTCRGSCTGTCAVEASGRCQGECHGVCQGGCSGKCQGECEGTCSARGADGQCNGKCQGVCHGTCTAGCKGSCEGECWVSGKAECNGECRGGCSVAWEEPRCTGNVQPPKVDAQCEASCDARMNAEARCEPGQAQVVVVGNASSNMQDKLGRVRAALESGWGEFLAIRAKLQRLSREGRALVQASKRVPGAVGNLGLTAASCATEAAAALPRAMANVSASVQVSVSMSAAVSAG